MMNVRKMILALVCFSMTACRVLVDVPTGGKVTVSDGDECLQGQRCVEVVDSDYKKTYTAVPEPGFVFVQWQDGVNHLHGGEISESVVIDASIAKENPTINNVVKTNSAFYLKPVFALRDYDTSPLGLPTLFRLDCDDCDIPKQIDWPASITESIDLWVLRGDWESEEEFVLGTFIIYAKESDYKIENLIATLIRDDGGENLARIEGLREGQVLRKGSQVIFKLLTKHRLAVLGSSAVGEFSFDIAGSDASFRAMLTVNMGSACEVC